MSLRARLLLGMGAIAVVLVLAGAAMLRTTERNLVEQVDDQLRNAGPALTRIPRGGPYSWQGHGQEQEEDQDTGGDDQQPRLSRLYVGQLTADDTLRTLYAPDLYGYEAPAPSLDDGDVER
ncbi:MAG: hypothetical protein M3Z03_04765, partial [Actinomycetota bacterium]|nr:hypothetical protein [Actinomycetota bacterium]